MSLTKRAREDREAKGSVTLGIEIEAHVLEYLN